jgi:hypothetical protein
MNKCCASQDGICRNTILFGTKCDGYKERCKLRPTYSALERTVKNYQHSLRKMFGVVINMSDKLTPEVTPQFAVSAFAVLHQYCSSISPHDCIRCTFYEHCPECFVGCPGDQGEVIRKLQENE